LLFILDVGGVLRDSSLAMYKAFQDSFSLAGKKIPCNAHELWHLRGIGKYNKRKKVTEALLAILKNNESLGKLLDGPIQRNCWIT